MTSSKDTVKTINHYKKSLEAQDVDEKRLLHCIGVLYKLPVTVTLLQETGIGRTVNGLCKSEAGEVRLSAKSLVNKWKALVANESSAEEDPGARHSQEEEGDAKKAHHSSSSSQRKDANRIKKERDHRSSHHHHHHKGSSRNDSEKHHHHHHQHSRPGNSSSGATNGNDLVAPINSSTGDPQTIESKKSSGNDRGDNHRSNGDKGERKRSRDVEHNKDRSSKRHRTDSGSKRSETKEELEIDNTAGTSFADALAMMDGPGTPAKSTKSINKPMISNNSINNNVEAVKTKGPSSGGASSSRQSSHTSANAPLPPSTVAGKGRDMGLIKKSLGPGSSKINRPSDSGSGPPKLLAPSFKLAPLLDPEELKKDILASTSSIVIGNSYTPASYLNPVNIAQVSAAITKNKRPVGGSAASMEPFEILQSKARTKVYSGNKCLQTVLSLHESCIRVLQKNVDALEYTGGVPFDILEPVLLKCTANQLNNIEYYNPYLSEDTSDLWKMHVGRQFRGKKRQEMESWREMYQRCQEEEEARLSSLTESIKQSQQTSIPLKQTKLAYMDRQAPHMGRRRGGGGNLNAPSLNASLASRTSVNGTRMGFLTAGREVQAKRAPLMQKTLALMKKSIKR